MKIDRGSVMFSISKATGHLFNHLDLAIQPLRGSRCIRVGCIRVGPGEMLDIAQKHHEKRFIFDLRTAFLNLKSSI
jgi:hypothetical protein